MKKILMTATALFVLCSAAQAYTGQPESRGTNGGAYTTSNDPIKDFFQGKNTTQKDKYGNPYLDGQDHSNEAAVVSPEPVVVPHKHHEVVMRIEIGEKNEGYYIDLSINGSPHFPCAIDTGASQTFFSAGLMDKLWNNGFMKKAEIVGSSSAIVADGKGVPTALLKINKVEIFGSGNSVSLADVQGMVSMPVKDKSGKRAPDQGRNICLLGQSFFKAFKSFKIDNDTKELTVEWYE